MKKEEKTLDSVIAAEKAKLAKLEEKQADIAIKIKTCKSNINKYTLMKNSNQFNALSNALDGKGISIEDILSAVSSGDLLGLQEKLEAVTASASNDEEEKNTDAAKTGSEDND